MARAALDGSLRWVTVRERALLAILAQGESGLVAGFDVIEKGRYSAEVVRISREGDVSTARPISGDGTILVSGMVQDGAGVALALLGVGLTTLDAGMGLTYAGHGPGRQDFVVARMLGATESIDGFAAGQRTSLGLTVDDRGHTFLCGSSTGVMDVLDGGAPQSNTAGVVVDLDEQGKPVWRFDMRSESGTFGITADVTVASCLATHDGVFVAGGVEGDLSIEGKSIIPPAQGHHAFILRISKSGDLVWARDLGKGSLGAAIDQTEEPLRLLIHGTFEGTLDFEGVGLRSNGKQDAFIAVVDQKNGHVIRVLSLGGSGDDRVGVAATGPHGSLVVSGSFEQTVDFGDGVPRTSKGETDIFLMKRAWP